MHETDDVSVKLDEVLQQWHAWALGYRPGRQGACPMFRSARSARGWEDSSDITAADVHRQAMRAVDFQVGEMPEPYRSAVYADARNLYTGRAVWTSPRLPHDQQERAVVVRDARAMLAARLFACGVL